MSHSALLDTSFFVRFLNEKDRLHKNAQGYFKYLIEKRVFLKVSTISIAEFCTRDSFDELPLRNLQILPFNIVHARRAGEFARILYDVNQKPREISPRVLIPNDAKLLAQADAEDSIRYFVTSDSRSMKCYEKLKDKHSIKFQFIDISTPYNETFGEFDFAEE